MSSNNTFDTTNISKFIKSEKSYKIFKIKYSNKEKKCIADFNIIKPYVYTSYNNLDNLEESFKKASNDNDNDSIKIMVGIVQKLLSKLLKAYNTQYYWIAIRIKTKNNFFDIPRWHCDSYYFTTRDRLQTKFVTTLKGPATLLLDTTPEEHKYFFEKSTYDTNLPVNLLEFDIEHRKKLDQSINGKRIQLNNNQGIIFTAGDFEKCLIHSEPKEDDNRIFISILPGTKEEIEELKNKFENINKENNNFIKKGGNIDFFIFLTIYLYC